MPELINGTYVSAIVLALLIPALINCKRPLRPQRPLRYKDCHNVIRSEAKNLGSPCIRRKTEMDQRCFASLNMTVTDEALQRMPIRLRCPAWAEETRFLPGLLCCWA